VITAAEPSEIMHRALALISAIESAANESDFEADLPVLDAATLEDGSVALEWIESDRRLGFSVEIDPSQSRWFYASLEGALLKGPINDNAVSAAVQRFISDGVR
jgi:hypothetical protein